MQSSPAGLTTPRDSTLDAGSSHSICASFDSWWPRVMQLSSTAFRRSGLGMPWLRHCPSELGVGEYCN